MCKPSQRKLAIKKIGAFEFCQLPKNISCLDSTAFALFLYCHVLEDTGQGRCKNLWYCYSIQIGKSLPQKFQSSKDKLTPRIWVYVYVGTPVKFTTSTKSYLCKSKISFCEIEYIVNIHQTSLHFLKWYAHKVQRFDWSFPVEHRTT